MGHAEASEDIDGSEDDGQPAYDLRQSAVTALEGDAGGGDGSHDGDGREGVHARHERRVEQAGHLPDDDIAQHGADGKDREEDEWMYHRRGEWMSGCIIGEESVDD